MSGRWLTPLLTVLVVVGWILSGVLYLQVNPLNEQLSKYEGEIGELKETVSEYEEKRLENDTIWIGVTTADKDSLIRTREFFEDIVEEDVNEYSTKIGYNITFRFTVRSNQGSAAGALENLQDFHEMGIDIVIGHPWSSQCYSSMPYVKDNDMLLFSPSSSSFQLSRPDDNLLRLCPDHTAQLQVVADMLSSRDIKSIIVLQLDAEPYNKLYEAFEEGFTELGGLIEERIICNSEEVYDHNSTNYLDEAEAAAREAVNQYGTEHVAVLAIGGVSQLVKQVRGYPTLYSLYWFGDPFTAKSQYLIEKAGEEIAHLKVFTSSPEPSESPLYTSLNRSYYSHFSRSLDYQMTATYDIAWIIAKSILVTQTTNTSELFQVIPKIASETYGASGWCKLNEAGDREKTDYGFWGYGQMDGKVKPIKYGRYDCLKDKVSWLKNRNATDP